MRVLLRFVAGVARGLLLFSSLAAPRPALAQSNACAGMPDGTLCDDGSSCTLADRCERGVCVGIPVADGLACTDGDGCTVDDRCQAGRCVGSRLPADARCAADDAGARDARDDGSAAETAPGGAAPAPGGGAADGGSGPISGRSDASRSQGSSGYSGDAGDDSAVISYVPEGGACNCSSLGGKRMMTGSALPLVFSLVAVIGVLALVLMRSQARVRVHARVRAPAPWPTARPRKPSVN